MSGGGGGGLGGAITGGALGGGGGAVIGGLLGSGALSGGLNGLLGGLGNPFNVGGLSAPPQTADQTVASAALSKRAGSLDTLGGDLLDKFSAGKLTTGQEAEISQSTGAANASANQFLVSAGLSDSSFGVGLRQQVDQQSQILRQHLLEGNFAEAMQALGLSSSDYSSVLSGGQFQQQLQSDTDQSNLNAQMAVVQGLLGVAGSTVGGRR